MVLIDSVVMNNCRLCHSKPGQFELNTDKKLIKDIYECIKIKVNDKSMDLLPRCICEECKRTVNSFLQYKQHVQKVDRSLRKILVNTKSKYDDGNSKAPPLNLFECQKCPETFIIENLFKKHIEIHSSKYTCNKSRSSEATYDTQLFKRKFDCVNCKTTFKTVDQYESHNCNISINNLKYFQKNVKVKEELEEKIEDNNSAFQIQNKLLTANEDDEVKKLCADEKFTAEHLGCNICEQSFTTSQDLKNHKKTHKTKFVCSWKNCEKVLNSAYTLKTHKLKHEGKRSFLCVTCGKGFITKNSLTCHEKIHLDVKGYTCHLCNIGFSVRSNLRAHEKKHHEGIRFYCSQCTKAFVSKCSLDRHERIHSGIKEFQCESCPSAFYTNKELMKHQRYHQGLRLHKCDECFKTFFERHHLIIHLRSHTGERPYVCKVLDCGKSFMESQKLKRHHSAKHAQT